MLCAIKQCPTLNNNSVTHIKHTHTNLAFSKISKHEKYYSKIKLYGDNVPQQTHNTWKLIHIELNYGNKNILKK